MVHGLQMITQRFAAHRDAVFDKLGRLAQCQRVAFGGVRSIGQVNVIGLLQGEQRLSR